MLKKTMTYTDFNGDTKTGDFYFNLTKADIAEMQLAIAGGMDTLITEITNSKDVPELIKLFKKIILLAYGEKSPDGTYFYKSEEISRKFAATQAYSDLFIELATDAEKAAAFINGIVPSDMAQAGHLVPEK